MAWMEQLREGDRDELLEGCGETVEFLEQLARTIREGSADPRSERPEMLPDLEGKGAGWLGGPFVIDQLRDLIADLEMLEPEA